MKNSRKSTQIALGGVFSSLCLAVMFMTGLIPFGTYAFPALAGVMLAVVVVENGSKVALMVYVSVSLLSLFVVPDVEATMMFIMLFGYYPVLKKQIERLRSKPLQYLLKWCVFVVTALAVYYAMIYLFGVPDMAQEFGEWGKYGAQLFLLAGSAVFLVYDYTITRYMWIYLYRFRGKFFRQ